MTKTFVSRLLMCLFFLGGTAFLAGCNTIEGAGQDIESTGEAIEDAAD